ncbi:hypothetical protein RND81_09G144000 [Saponaria officinalis]|uniref:Retrotransposon gag domain-containing protein n=1 Tax=Saponaria officinalis TaxID=3572 RepID=A0AAW1ILP1_SAPOF
MHNTRSANLNLEPFDSEIERTIFRFRKDKSGQLVVVQDSQVDEPQYASDFSDNSDESDVMAARSIKELTAPDLTNQPLCITIPPLAAGVNFELKSGLIHLLPSFHGLNGEDPNKYLSDFHIVCSSMKPAGVTDEQLKLRAFPFSLKDAARDWLYYLPTSSIDTWIKMKRAFLEKYFPASRSSQLKKEISNAEQRDGESMYEYWERFKKLCGTCPYHGYEDHDLVLYFTGGLSKDDARMLHAASGGGIANKNPNEAIQLITELAESSRDFDRKAPRRGVNAVGASNALLEEKVDSLTALVKDLVVGKKSVMACGICSSESHHSENCPQMREESPYEEVNAAGYMEPGQRKWDPYSNTFNAGWKANPAFRWGNTQGNPSHIQGNPSYTQGNQSGPPRGQYLNRPQNPPPNSQIPPQPTSSSSMSTNEMIRALVANQGNFQASVAQNQLETKNSIKNLKTQIGQMATAISRLEARDSNTLPSQTVTNPRPNVSAVSLRNGRQLVEAEKPVAKSKRATLHEEEEAVVETSTESPGVEVKDDEPPPVQEVEVPFPEALKSTRRIENDKDIYETFRKCEVNIPLLDLLKSVPKYAKFLKELCTVKRQQRLKGAQKVKVSEHVSAMFQRKLPPKCGDPGMFTIPCTLGDTRIERAMLDLGASINVLPYSLYKSMKLGALVETGVVIQLADRSKAYPKGVVEDVLVMVDNLIFPADFYVLEMEHDKHAAPILLG